MKKIIFIAFVLLGCLNMKAQQTDSLLLNYRMMALQYNHDLKAAEKNISASIEMEKAAHADLKPKLSAGADFQYTGNPLELTIDMPAQGINKTFQGRDLRYGASLTLLQPVYTGGQLIESIRMAQHQHSLTGKQAELIGFSVCYQTDIQYWSTVARGEIVRVTTDYRNSIASLVQTIQERVEVGLVDPQDLLMAEVKLNEAEFQLLQAQNNFETGRMALNSLIGIQLDFPSELSNYIPPIASDDALLWKEYYTRPEIGIAEDKIKIAESSLKLNSSKYKPQLFVGVDGSYSSPGYDFKKDLDPNYAVYAKLSIPIFEWGKRRNEKRSYSFKVGMATDNLNKVEDAVNLEIQTAQLSLLKAIERIHLSESSLIKALENEQKALERYAEGKNSIIEVIEAQTYRQTAEINNVQARASAQGHYSELIKAKGQYNYQ